MKRRDLKTFRHLKLLDNMTDSNQTETKTMEEMEAQTLSTVVITKSGGLKEKELSVSSLVDENLVQELENVTRNKGQGSIKLIGGYPSHGILLFGWTGGKHSMINKHELAPPYDTDLFYGDLVVLSVDCNKVDIATMNSGNYDSIYEELHKGFDSLDESEVDEYDYDEQVNTEEEDPDYDPNEPEPEDDETIGDETVGEEDEEGEWNFDEDTDTE